MPDFLADSAAALRAAEPMKAPLPVPTATAAAAAAVGVLADNLETNDEDDADDDEAADKESTDRVKSVGLEVEVVVDVLDEVTASLDLISVTALALDLAATVEVEVAADGVLTVRSGLTAGVDDTVLRGGEMVITSPERGLETEADRAASAAAAIDLLVGGETVMISADEEKEERVEAAGRLAEKLVCDVSFFAAG